MTEMRMDGLGVCYRWAWSWRGFWIGWWSEVKGFGMLAWMGLVGICGALVQALVMVAFPVWRLLIEPLKVGLSMTPTEAENMRKVLDSKKR